MKKPITWHTESLNNAIRSLDYQHDELTRMKKKIVHDKAAIRFRQAQITEAEKRGMADFDADRLLVGKDK